jgi:urease subunit alpha
MFGSFGAATSATSITFTSQASLAAGMPQKLGLQRPLAAVKNCRKLGKKDMVHNYSTPEITVDPETYEVRVDGELITCEPARELPLTQRYFLF